MGKLFDARFCLLLLAKSTTCQGQRCMECMHSWYFLLSLDANLKFDALQTTGSVLYNGHSFEEFVVQRTAAYIDQVSPSPISLKSSDHFTS